LARGEAAPLLGLESSFVSRWDRDEVAELEAVAREEGRLGFLEEMEPEMCPSEIGESPSVGKGVVEGVGDAKADETDSFLE